MYEGYTNIFNVSDPTHKRNDMSDYDDDYDDDNILDCIVATFLRVFRAVW